MLALGIGLQQVNNLRRTSFALAAIQFRQKHGPEGSKNGRQLLLRHMSGGRTDLRLLDSAWGRRLLQVPGGEIKQTFSHFQQKIMWQWHGPQ